MSNSKHGPAPTTSGEALAAYWRQSWGKAVGEVSTILGTEPVPACPPDRLRRCAPELRDRLETTMPRRRLTAAEGTDAERLTVAGSSAVAVRRIVAGDRYVLHRAYPSPRALFGVDLWIHPDERTRNLALPWDGELAPAPESSEVFDPMSLSAHVRPGRYPEPYGSLRPSLARLEAGHLLATAGLTAYVGGLELTTIPGGSGDVAGVLTPKPVQAPHNLLVASEQLAEMVDVAATAPQQSLGQWLAKRTSGSSMANLVTSMEVGRAAAAALDDIVAQGMRLLGELLPPGLITAHRTVLRGRGMTDRTMSEVDGTGAGRERPLTATAAWSSALGYTWSIDPIAWERELSGLSRGTVHVLLGWLCQWVCLGAAGLELAARPARNFDEGNWAEDLGLPPGLAPAYQVWIRPIDEHDQVRAAWTTHGRNV